MITGFVQGQVLRLSAPVVAADTLDYLTAQFVFRSADWSGMEKWAHFAKGGTVYDVRLTEDKIRREDHLNLSAGEWKVYVHGNRFADGAVVERITTAEDVLRVVPTGTIDGEPFPELPASVTEQILARLENVEQNGGGGGGQQVSIDDTLTKPGHAADAKAVGEKINQLSGKIADNAPTINYVETKTVYLGDNVIGAATLGAGWTETGGVFIHATGNDDDLSFETAVEEGAIYILEFDTSYTSNEFVRVGIGDRYRVLCYQGKSHITVPLMASGGTTLYITPIDTTYTGSISNITLRKIQDNGTELVLEIYNTATDNHTQNYGFWNTFIGKNVAENAVGSARSVGIGYFTLNALQGGHRNIGIGTFAMSQMIGGEDNVAIGADNMLEVKEAAACVSIGFAAMYKGKKRTEDIAIGISAMRGDATSDTSGNIAIGKQAGYKVTTAKSNVFLGKQAGYNLTSGYSNTLIGDGAAKSLTTGYFNTVVGRNAVVPAAARGTVVIGDGATATKNYQAVIGADNITETLVKGNLVVRGTDGVNRQIVFNADGTCSWTAVT